MGFPYSSGDVLKASDLNASSGLVLVKTQTIAGGVSSVTVPDAFSSTFDNYKVIVSGMDTSVSNYSVEFQFDGSASNYYWAGWYRNYSNTAGGFLGQTSHPHVPVGYTSTTESTVCEFTVFDPYNSAKRGRVSVMPSPGNDYVISVACEHAQVASYTGFKLLLASPGTMSGGTIRVYGYNNG